MTDLKTTAYGEETYAYTWIFNACPCAHMHTDARTMKRYVPRRNG